ncbi:MAG: type II toxin-antitoxin system RelE/ParE family toxin [Candidatus Omnitrophica bacterium]|nr:type II toxin-antitoxin system RelE/ParE family toxin [Candidatus Omnitrophota bacterium]MBU4478688.1 type II toxin-antitoxin system RelE/ParE family toxin [Candidatus Omnitrophota bacterium]
MYKIVYTKEAVTAIKQFPYKKQHQIKEAIERIAENPGIGKHLTHELKGLSSYRSGDYRIIYRIQHKEILVIILTVGHRRDIYKRTVRKIDNDL